MGFPTEVQGCASTYDGPMGGAGWVREIECGHTPDVRVPAEMTQYYQDPTDPSHFHLRAFGLLKDISDSFNPNQLKTRSIGSRDIECNKHSKYESKLDVGYLPIDLQRIPFITGIDADIQTLREPVCVEDCLPFSSVETWHERECPTEEAVRFLYDMMIVSSFKCEVSIGEYVKWSESLMGRYQRYSTTKLYAAESPYDEVEVGLNPLKPCCDAFMAYEGDIYTTIQTTNNLTPQIDPAGSSIFILGHNVMDWNRDNVIDGLLGNFHDKVCFRDIEVYVDGVLINDTNTVTVSAINSKYIQLATPILPGQTITATYHYMYQLFNITAYDFEINHNVKESRGIWKGLPIPYGLQNVIRDYSGTMTANFKDDVQYLQMRRDQYFHIFLEQGGLSLTPIVWEFLFAKWDDHNPPHNEDDLISVSMPWTSQYLCIDNQIRMPPNGSAEEG